MTATPDRGWPGPAELTSIALASGLFIWFFQAIPAVSSGETLRWSWAWAPSLGVKVSFYLDGLSLTFGLLISGIGVLVMLYSARYLRGHRHLARFFVFLTSFMLAMLGLIMADSLLTLFVFWELTTITSYLLVGFDHESRKGRRSALQALLVTGAGGLALLAGIILIGTVAGTFELSEIRAMPSILTQSTLYLPILILVLLGAFTKSAQFPFHFWLPNAMAAPTPVSAYLHSATMVKAGVYLLARLHPSLSGTDVWLWTLTIFGAITAVFASVLALRQTDLKQTLAYTTLMALGSLTLLLGNSIGYAITAAVTFLVVHSLYKAALFLVIGIIDYRAGTREVEELSGLAKAMPITATAAMIAALSMAGFPPFLGFIGKELKYAGALAVASEPVLVAGAVLLSSALMLAVAGVLALKPFWGPPKDTPKSPSEGPWAMLLGPVILALLGAISGIWPDLIAQPLVTQSVAAILGEPEEAKELKLWAGINLPLLLSLVTFALGILLFVFSRRLRLSLITLTERMPKFDNGWDQLIKNVLLVARWQTRILQTGHLRHYILVTFSTVLLAMVVGLAASIDQFSLNLTMPDLGIEQYLLIALVFMGTGLTVVVRSRIAAIAGLGVVGISAALIFILYSAPDVAITQLLVETLIVVLFAAAALRLPSMKPDPVSKRPLDAVLAVGIDRKSVV